MIKNNNKDFDRVGGGEMNQVAKCIKNLQTPAITLAPQPQVMKFKLNSAQTFSIHLFQT